MMIDYQNKDPSPNQECKKHLVLTTMALAPL